MNIDTKKTDEGKTSSYELPEDKVFSQDMVIDHKTGGKISRQEYYKIYGKGFKGVVIETDNFQKKKKE